VEWDAIDSCHYEQEPKNSSPCDLEELAKVKEYREEMHDWCEKDFEEELCQLQ